MHEWALAEGVVSTVDKLAEEDKRRKENRASYLSRRQRRDAQGPNQILEVIVKIGELQQIDHETFKFALEQLRTNKTAETKFILETVPASLTCRACGEKWRFNAEQIGKEKTEAIHFLPEIAHIYIQCPKCKSPDFEITEGRGVWLGHIKGTKKDD